MQGPWTGTSIVCDGQSLANYPARPGRYIDYAVAALDDTTFRRFVVADDSEAWGTLDDDLPTRVNHILVRASFSIMILQGGQTDLALGGATAANLLTTVNAYADAARTAGADKIIYTTLPPADVPGFYSSDQNTRRTDHNGLAIAQGTTGGHFDAVVDVASLLTYPTHFADVVHLNAAGAVIFGNAVAPTIAGFMP